MNESLMELQQSYRRIRRNVLFFILYIILCGLFLFWVPEVALFLLGAAVLIQCFVLRKQQKNYTKQVTRQNLLQTTCKQLDAAPPKEKSGGFLTKEHLVSTGLMPIDQGDHSCLLCLGISGVENGLEIHLCDATLTQSFRLSSKGKRRVHFNAGAWIRIVLPRDTGADWRILDETSIPTPIRMEYFSHRLRLAPAPLPDAELAPRMVLYSPVDGENSPPPPAVLSQLKRLVQYTPGYVAVSLQGNTLDLFLRGRFLSRPVSMSAPPSEERLGFDPLPELAYCIRLAEAVVKNTAKTSSSKASNENPEKEPPAKS